MYSALKRMIIGKKKIRKITKMKIYRIIFKPTHNNLTKKQHSDGTNF